MATNDGLKHGPSKGDVLQVRLVQDGVAIINEAWPINTQSARVLATELLAAVEKWRASVGATEARLVN